MKADLEGLKNRALADLSVFIAPLTLGVSPMTYLAYVVAVHIGRATSESEVNDLIKVIVDVYRDIEAYSAPIARVARDAGVSLAAVLKKYGKPVPEIRGHHGNN